MRQLFIFLLLIATGSTGTRSLATEFTSTEDSLLKVVNALPADSSRLEKLYSLACQEPTSPSCAFYLGALLKEAIHQDNKWFQGLAMYAHVVYYFNQQNEENTVSWMNKLSEIALKHKFYDLYFPGKRAEITIHIIKRRIEYSITEAEAMYHLARKVNNREGMSAAKLCLMIAYSMSARYDEGIAAGVEAYNLLPAAASGETRAGVLQEITLSCFAQKDKHLLKYLQEYKSILNKLSEGNSSATEYRNSYLLMESVYAGYYLDKADLDEARIHLKKMDEYFSPQSYTPNRGLYYDVYSHYYRLIREYDKALICADSAINLLSELSDNGGLNYRINRAGILADKGCLDEAIPLFQEVLAKKDSFYRDLSASQMEEIHHMRNMDDLLLEKEQHTAIIHYIMIALIIIALLILIPSTVRIYCVRKRLKKEEEKIREMTLIAEEANEVKSRFLANISYNIRTALNNVLGFSQLMTTNTEEVDPSQWHTYSEIVQSNSATLLQLVNNLLDLSRLEAGKTKWQIQDHDIIPLCSDIISIAQMRCENKIQINFQTKIESQPFQTDISRFTQVLLSMLVPANPYEEDKAITFSLNRKEDEGLLLFRIVNSPLADPEQQTQQTEVQNSINRLTIAYFGGTYTVEPHAPEGPTIIFTYSYHPIKQNT